MVRFSYFCPQENLPFRAVFTYFIEDSGVRTTVNCPSTNRLSVPLSAWRVGTPSHFAYAQYLKGGESA